MAEYRTTETGERVYTTTDGRDPVYVEKRGGAGRTLLILAVVAVAIVALLFATGFFRANVQGGSLPKVNVDARGGALPNVDVDSKRVVVGTRKETVEVPTVGVTEGDRDGKR